jgi:hypothetical protein
VQEEDYEAQVELSEFCYHPPESLIGREYLVDVGIQITERKHKNDDCGNSSQSIPPL